MNLAKKKDVKYTNFKFSNIYYLQNERDFYSMSPRNRGHDVLVQTIQNNILTNFCAFLLFPPRFSIWPKHIPLELSTYYGTIGHL